MRLENLECMDLPKVLHAVCGPNACANTMRGRRYDDCDGYELLGQLTALPTIIIAHRVDGVVRSEND